MVSQYRQYLPSTRPIVYTKCKLVFFFVSYTIKLGRYITVYWDHLIYIYIWMYDGYRIQNTHAFAIKIYSLA